MAAARPLLRLVLPGLLQAPAAARPARLPALETLLARGRHSTAAGGIGAQQLQEQFASLPQLAAGAVGWLGEGGEPGDGYWLCADPVHLQPGLDQVTLLAGPQFSPTAAQARQLADECNLALGEQGLSLHAGRDRWYLRLQQPLTVSTTPTLSLIGSAVYGDLPADAAGADWLRLQNRVQMLLHASPVNAARQAAGQAPINAMWFWGGGVLPAAPVRRWDAVVGEGSLPRGWARLTGAEPAAADLSVLAAGRRVLVFDSRLEQALANHDLTAWEQGLHALEGQWLAPALAKLAQGRLIALELAADGRLWRLQRSMLLRFWRRLRPWHVYRQESL